MNLVTSMEMAVEEVLHVLILKLLESLLRRDCRDSNVIKTICSQFRDYEHTGKLHGGTRASGPTFDSLTRFLPFS
jgi:hypothetical protein